MKWLVVGSRGQLGRSFCEILGANGLEFAELSHDDGNISVRNFVDSKIDSIRPGIIINAAAWTDVDAAETNESEANFVNADAVGYLAIAAKRLGSIFVHISTDYVFSGIGNVPWSEGDEKKPISAYGRSKAKGEDHVIKLYPEKSYIFRTSWLYSKYGTNFVKSMIRIALKNQNQVKVVGDQIGQPTNARDLVHQIMESIESRIPFGIYHATNAGQASWFEFAQEIFRNCDSDLSRILWVTSEEYPSAANRPAFSVLGQNAWANTGVKPMGDWEQAFKECFPEILNAVRAEG